MDSFIACLTRSFAEGISRRGVLGKVGRVATGLVLLSAGVGPGTALALDPCASACGGFSCGTVTICAYSCDDASNCSPWLGRCLEATATQCCGGGCGSCSFVDVAPGKNCIECPGPCF